MLNPYAPPSDQAPIPRAEAIVEHRSMWFLFSIAIGTSAIAAMALVAKHYFSSNLANPIAALAMAGIVAAIQVIASAQIARRSQTRTNLLAQCVNALSWLAVVGVLGAAHYLLPSVPELRGPDLIVFGGLAIISAMLGLLTSALVKRWS